MAWHKLRPTKTTPATPFQSQVIDGLTANFIAPDGQLHSGRNDILIEFRDGNGQLVDVGSVKLDVETPSMQMHSDASVERSNTAGRYRAKINILMPADWTSKLSFEGPQGKKETTFSMSAK
jgi:YtkA-like protein